MGIKLHCCKRGLMPAKGVKYGGRVKLYLQNSYLCIMNEFSEKRVDKAFDAIFDAINAQVALDAQLTSGEIIQALGEVILNINQSNIQDEQNHRSTFN